MRVALRSPSPELEATFLAGLDELDGDDERAAWVYLGGAALVEAPRRGFASYVARLLARAHAPAPGFVADTTFWAVADGEMVGRISLRHALTDALEREGGHIGYIVRPSARRQGVATEMLRLVLGCERARAIGRLLVTCDDGNVGSEKSIRNNGGVLADVVEPGRGERPQKRFWIPAR